MGVYAALVRKDLQIFFGDRRAVILTLAVPIAIASFFGAIFSGAGGGGTSEPARIAVMAVDDDQSAISKAIVARNGEGLSAEGLSCAAGRRRAPLFRTGRRRLPSSSLRALVRQRGGPFSRVRSAPRSACCSIRRGRPRSRWSAACSPDT